MKSSVLFSLVAPAAAVTALANDKDMTLKTRPIMKIVRMLEDMKVELNKELEDDKAVHEMMDCWCSTNEKEKTKAIEMGTTRINELEALLGETLAKIKEIKTKIEEHTSELQSHSDLVCRLLLEKKKQKTKHKTTKKKKQLP